MDNFNNFPIQLGSKHQFCGVLVLVGVNVVLKDTMDECGPYKMLKMGTNKSQSLVQHTINKFPKVLESELGYITHYNTPRVKFKRGSIDGWGTAS